MDTQASAFRWLIQLLSTQHKRLALSMILAVGYSLLSLVPYVLIYQLIANFLYPLGCNFSALVAGGDGGTRAGWQGYFAIGLRAVIPSGRFSVVI